MLHWDELQTAYQVARCRTVSAAAEALGIQRATVIRHIDNLERELGAKLFQRHQRGYTPTDIGKDLLQTVRIADSEFKQLKARAKGSDSLHGEFIITSLEYLAPWLMPSIKIFRQQHPAVEIHYSSSEHLLKLEYGQAHIAIRNGEKPQHPDYVVKPFMTLGYTLFAHRHYIEQYGKPAGVEDFSQHLFVAPSETSNFSKININQWLIANVPKDNIVLQSNSSLVLMSAIQNGMGIGVMPYNEAQKHPELQQVYDDNPDWHVNSWLVTHGDLHRSDKVQHFLQILTENQTALTRAGNLIL